MRFIRRVRHVIVACLIAGLAGPVLADGPLRVLLTNDDGVRAPGLVAVRDALTAAGHEVTVIAPRGNRSGSSASVTTGVVRFGQVADTVWAVDGSPADAVAVGLAHVFAERPPDLVVSGANQGQNLGAIVNLSGTVGAAIMATLQGVPAIAVSVGMSFDEAGASPEPFPSTRRTYPAAAALVVRLVDALVASRAGPALLPPRTLLNVNYPAVAPTAFKGVALALPGASMGYGLRYQATGTPGELALILSNAPPPGSEAPTADTVLFAAGHATVTVLDGRWGAPAALAAEIARRLERALTVAGPPAAAQ